MANKRQETSEEYQQEKDDAVQQAERAIKQRLVQLMRDAVPSVPRKINRVGELFDLYLNIAALKDWHMHEAREKLTLLRLVILQLLAPDIYRFGRFNKGFLRLIRDWVAEHGRNMSIDHLQEEIQSRANELVDKLRDKNVTETDRGTLYVIKKIEQPLIQLIQTAQQERSHFNPFNLFDPKYIPQDKHAKDTDLDTNIWRYFNLENSLVESVAKQWSDPHEKTSAALSNPESFFSLLFSHNENDRQRAIEQEAELLTGHVFDEGSFEQLINMASNSSEIVSVDWLELIEPYLTAQQLNQVFQVSDLLGRINKQLGEGVTDGDG